MKIREIAFHATHRIIFLPHSRVLKSFCLSLNNLAVCDLKRLFMYLFCRVYIIPNFHLLWLKKFKFWLYVVVWNIPSTYILLYILYPNLRPPHYGFFKVFATKHQISDLLLRAGLLFTSVITSQNCFVFTMTRFYFCIFWRLSIFILKPREYFEKIIYRLLETLCMSKLYVLFHFVRVFHDKHELRCSSFIVVAVLRNSSSQFILCECSMTNMNWDDEFPHPCWKEI